ncbi:MAG: thioredoxin domain-containing protein [Candidatus Kerfeldbacteria bacterium]|nr:thioredoxin domain-containing protein [Candidatus Kerfeldbacteria bacterium]
MATGKFKSLLPWLIGVVVIAGGVYGLVKLGGGTSSSTSALLLDAAAADDWVRGTAGSGVVLIEFSDLQCPACKSYEPLVSQLTEDYGDRITFIYRHFPLRTTHPNAEAAARAAEAAGKQGKFWEMHDLLFDKQEEWSRGNVNQLFESYAQSLSLNLEQYRRDIADQAVIDRIESHYQSGLAARVSGTPTFFLNGTKISNPRSYDDFKAKIEAALKNPVQSTATDQEIHLHADLRVVVDGAAIDFSQDTYQSTKAHELNPEVHFHDGNGKVFHVHAAGVTLNDLLTSFGMDLSRDCLKLNSGESRCATGEKKLRLYVNGTESTEAGEYVIKDLDRILIFYGAPTTAAVDGELTAVSNDACIYSEKCPERGKPPTEDCVGGLGTDCE